MKGSKEKVIMGSGEVFIEEFTGGLPGFEELREKMMVEEKRAGWIKGGASIEYKPTMTLEKDDMGHVVKEVLTDEEATFKTGFFTWNAETLSRLCSTARVETKGKYRILKVGGTKNDDGKQYVILFVHKDPVEGDCYLVIVGRNSAGFSVTYATDSATVIEAEFACRPQDGEGTLIQYIEEIEEKFQNQYTEEELNVLKVEQIKLIASEKNYTITKTLKQEIIEEFLAAQTAAEEQ